MTARGVIIRPATEADSDAIWSVLEPVYRAGETYCIPRDITRSDALTDWFAPPFTAFVSEVDGMILGTSHIGANRPGGGAHVANASFATHPQARGKGIARGLAEHARTWARGNGFTAMQFNFVVSTNTEAVYLWQKLGFDIVGRLPRAFVHPDAGPVDALIMFQELKENPDEL